MIPFPNISPGIFILYGSFEVALRWYALSYFGFVLALYIMKYLLKREASGALKHLWT